MGELESRGRRVYAIPKVGEAGGMQFYPCRGLLNQKCQTKSSPVGWVKGARLVHGPDWVYGPPPPLPSILDQGQQCVVQVYTTCGAPSIPPDLGLCHVYSTDPRRTGMGAMCSVCCTHCPVQLVQDTCCMCCPFQWVWDPCCMQCPSPASQGCTLCAVQS